MVTDSSAIALPTDALLRIETECGGQSRISNDDYIEGAPELIVEIASSSASYNMHEKLQVYRRNGVQEYLVCLVDEQAILWYRLQEGIYVPLASSDRGLLISETFPGLWLDALSLLHGDLASALAIVQEGIASSAHQDFVQQIVQVG